MSWVDSRGAGNYDNRVFALSSPWGKNGLVNMFQADFSPHEAQL